MLEENLHAGGKWETMSFLGVALHFDFISTVKYVKNLICSIVLHFDHCTQHTAKSLSYHFTNISGTYFGP